MYPSTNTRSDPTASNEITINDPSNSSYVTQTDFPTTIKHLLAKFDDNQK